MKSLTPTPTGWSNNTDHCKWKGISCDSSRSVTSIMLPSSSFTGTLLPTSTFSLNSPMLISTTTHSMVLCLISVSSSCSLYPLVTITSPSFQNVAFDSHPI
ncbi:receptor kinase TMK4 [Trifolium repens]|nr:receptor kinase TMK4 [Trifolium repens]